MTTKAQQVEIDQAAEALREAIPEGSTVYTILRSVSRSGMQREIGTVVFEAREGREIEPRHWNYRIALVLGRRLNENADGIVVKGCGMDMGFELVYSLAQALYGNGYALAQRWL